MIETKEELSISTLELRKAGSKIEALDTVTMASGSPPPRASMEILKGHWYYKFEVGVVSQTPSNATFKVELLRWNERDFDYDLVGTLYVKTPAGTLAGTEKARLLYNLGSTPPLPGSSELFMVVVTKVTQ